MQLTTHGNDPYLSVMTENKEYNKRSDEALHVLAERGLRLRRKKLRRLSEIAASQEVMRNDTLLRSLRTLRSCHSPEVGPLIGLLRNRACAPRAARAAGPLRGPGGC